MFHNIIAMLKKKKLAVALTSGLAIIVILIVIVTSNSTEVSQVSAKDKYVKVMKNGSENDVKNLLSKAEYFSDLVEFYEMLTKGSNVSDGNVFSDISGAGVEIWLGNEIKNNITDSLKINRNDSGWIDTVGAKGNVYFGEGLTEFDVNLVLNNADLTGLNCIYDAPKNDWYVSAPDLLTKVLKIEKNSDGDANRAEKNEKSPTVSDILAMIAESDMSQEHVNRYIDRAFSHITDFSAKSETVDISSVSQKQTVLTAKIDSETCRNLINEVLEEFCKDEELILLIETVAASNGYDGKKISTDILNHAQNLLENKDFENIKYSDFYVDLFSDDDGSFLGFCVKSNSFEFEYRIVKNKNKKGTKLKILRPDVELEFFGSAETSNEMTNGNYNLKYDGINVLEFELKDFDVSAFENGNISGIVRIKPSQELNSFFSGANSLSKFVGMEFELRFISESEENDFEIVVQKNNEKYFSVKINPFRGDKKTITVPSREKCIDFSSGMDAHLLVSHLTPVKFIDGLKRAGAPATVTTTLETVFSLMKNMM